MSVAETTRGRRWRLLLPVLGLGAVLGVAACGGGDNGGGSTGGSAAAPKSRSRCSLYGGRAETQWSEPPGKLS